jgi:act minimal PKS ketosynthase (KS/KS alpha)
VVTGIGVIAPGGIGTKQFWELLCAGRTATRTISLFDASGFRSRVAAECDFDPVASGLSQREIRKWDRTTQFAVVAAKEALDDSGVLGETDPYRTGVMVGTACGMTQSLDREYAIVSDNGSKWHVDEAHGSPYLYDYFAPSSMAAELAWLAEAQGPVGVISTGCTSGIDVLGHAADLIIDGAADVMISGASDAAISPITVACFDAIRATTPRNDDPATASRPFDRTRNGFALGEGSAVLVLEEYGHARRRGARVYAEIAGHATRANAFSMTGLRPDGRELAEAITVALDRAEVNPADVGYINAHGSSTKQNDLHETIASHVPRKRCSGAGLTTRTDGGTGPNSSWNSGSRVRIVSTPSHCPAASATARNRGMPFSAAVSRPKVTQIRRCPRGSSFAQPGSVPVPLKGTYRMPRLGGASGTCRLGGQGSTTSAGSGRPSRPRRPSMVPIVLRAISCPGDPAGSTPQRRLTVGIPRTPPTMSALNSSGSATIRSGFHSLASARYWETM